MVANNPDKGKQYTNTKTKEKNIQTHSNRKRELKWVWHNVL